MIKLTQKEFDLLEQVAKYEVTAEKPYKIVSVNNGNLTALQSQGLIDTRPKNNLFLEVVLTTTGLQVFNNEIEHEIVLNEQHTKTTEETQMDQVDQTTETASVPTYTVGGQFVIEDNIPMPDIPVVRKPREGTMPLEQMQVGQSFLVPFKEGEDIHKGRKRVSATVSQTKKRKLGSESTALFVTAIVENGYRVWRKA